MGKFDVYVFLAHSYLPAPVSINQHVTAEPFIGFGGLDTIELINLYLENILAQPTVPDEHKVNMSKRQSDQDNSVVIKSVFKNCGLQRAGTSGAR
jgi:hypothetical protein